MGWQKSSKNHLNVASRQFLSATWIADFAIDIKL